MSKALCPANCGKKFVTEEAAHKHADEHHADWRTPKRKGWATPYGFGDWSYPITYDDACERMKAIAATIKWPQSPKPGEQAEMRCLCGSNSPVYCTFGTLPPNCKFVGKSNQIEGGN